MSRGNVICIHWKMYCSEFTVLKWLSGWFWDKQPAKDLGISRQLNGQRYFGYDKLAYAVVELYVQIKTSNYMFQPTEGYFCWVKEKKFYRRHLENMKIFYIEITTYFEIMNIQPISLTARIYIDIYSVCRWNHSSESHLSIQLPHLSISSTNSLQHYVDKYTGYMNATN